MAVLSDAEPLRDTAYCHEALFYAGDADLLAATVPFINDGLEADEPVLVVVRRPGIDLLREGLGEAAGDVCFLDMSVVGHNPARIIPAWREFLDRQVPTGRPVRGIGEPIWPERAAAELVECQRHESLLNVAFGDDEPLWLLCPYDVGALDEAVIEEARRSHRPLGSRRPPPARESFLDAMAIAHLDSPLPPPPDDCEALPFGAFDIHKVRQRVGRLARLAGLTAARSFDLGLAVSELATNSVRHGGGEGTLRLWTEDGAAVCEVTDRGRLAEPLAGRCQPDVDGDGRRGLWMVNQLCDLMQIRVYPSGSVVRVRMDATGR